MADYSCVDCKNHWDSLHAFKVVQTIQPDWCLSIIAHVTFLTHKHTAMLCIIIPIEKYRYSVLCVFFCWSLLLPLPLPSRWCYVCYPLNIIFATLFILYLVKFKIASAFQTCTRIHERIACKHFCVLILHYFCENIFHTNS